MKTKLTVLTILLTVLILSLGLALTGCAKSYASAELNVPNLAQGATIHSTSSGNGNKVLDSSYNSFWKPKGKSAEWLIVDLNSSTTFNSILLRERTPSVAVFRILVSDDMSTWRSVYISDGLGGYKLCSVGSESARYIKLVVDRADKAIEISDLQVFNLSSVGDVNNTAFFDSSIGKLSAYTDEQKLSFREYFISSYDELIFNHTASIKSLTASNIDDVVAATSLEVNAASSALNGLDVRIGVSLHHDGDIALTQVDYDNISALVTKLGDIPGLTIVNFDWQNIDSTNSWRAFNSFIKALCPSAQAKGIAVTLTLPASNVELQLDTVRMIDKVYYVGYYTRTLLFSDCNFYNTAYLATNYLQSIGFTKSQIVLGLPFYGISSTDSSITLLWKDYAISLSSYWQNSLYNVYHMERIDNYSFNSYTLIKDKTLYANAIGLRGIAAFNINYDLNFANPLSLSKAITS